MWCVIVHPTIVSPEHVACSFSGVSLASICAQQFVTKVASINVDEGKSCVSRLIDMRRLLGYRADAVVTYPCLPNVIAGSTQPTICRRNRSFIFPMPFLHVFLLTLLLCMHIVSSSSSGTFIIIWVRQNSL